MKSEQIQRAGSDSTQIQAGTLIQYQGINEERVRAIVSEQCDVVVQNCLYESRHIAEQRVSEFKTELLSIFAKQPSLMESLQEPACANTLEKAIEAASRSETKNEKALLSELLISRFENPTNKHVATGVSRAIEVVDLVTESELQALTILYVLSYLRPNSGSVKGGLIALDGIYGELGFSDLPHGESWIDSLEVHNALRLSSVGSLKRFADYLYDSFEGYTARGIESGSDAETEAIELLRSANVSPDLLVNHELNPGYKRLNVVNDKQISEGTVPIIKEGKEKGEVLKKEQIEIVLQVSAMCKGTDCVSVIKENLLNIVKSFPALSFVSEWWDQIPTAIHLTIVGRLLAKANANRMGFSLPGFEDEE